MTQAQTGERRGIHNIEVFSPSVQVRFHRDDDTVKADFADAPGGVEADLISVQTYKDIGQPAGTFMIHLADRRRYDREIKPMDLCTIKFSTHTPKSPRTGNISDHANRHTHAAMIGFVDSVKRKRLIDPTTGKPKVFCEIRGRDFGKLMVKHQVRYIPWLMDQQENEAMVSPVIAMFKSLLSGFQSGGAIDWLIIDNLRRFFSNSVDITFPYNKRRLNIRNALSYRAMKDMGVIPYNLPLQGQEGSLWQILTNYANLPFNEMWIDTTNNPERVISKSEVSPHSSPLSGDAAGLAALKQRTKLYIDKQSGDDKKRSQKVYGANAEKVGYAEKYRDSGGSDISNAYTMLFFRRTPFDQDDWNALPRYYISDEDVYEQDIGVNDHETYNFFWVYPLLGIPAELALKAIGCQPLMYTKYRQFRNSLGDAARPKAVILRGDASPKSNDKSNIALHARNAAGNSVEKFGFNPLEVKTRVWRWARAAQTGGTVETCNMLTLTLGNWFKYNSRLKNGSLTIKGAPDLHVGNVLRNIDEKEEYYVEGIANNYVQYQPVTTTAMVTRGQPYEGPGVIPWGNIYRDYCKTAPLKTGSQKFEVKE